MPSDDSDTTASWNQSRQLIISELRRVDGSIRSLADKIDQLNEKGRDRMAAIEATVALQMSDVRERVAMLEVRAKIWGGMVGFLSGAIASGMVALIGKLVAK